MNGIGLFLTGSFFGVFMCAFVTSVVFTDDPTTEANLVKTGHGYYDSLTGEFKLKEIKCPEK
jgi:hypothetical protein